MVMSVISTGMMKRGMSSGYDTCYSHISDWRFDITAYIADAPNPMFYMPGTKILFGDAKDSCEGALFKFSLVYAVVDYKSHACSNQEGAGS
jgi:hypothetical protein